MANQSIGQNWQKAFQKIWYWRSQTYFLNLFWKHAVNLRQISEQTKKMKKLCQTMFNQLNPFECYHGILFSVWAK